MVMKSPWGKKVVAKLFCPTSLQLNLGPLKGEAKLLAGETDGGSVDDWHQLHRVL